MSGIFFGGVNGLRMELQIDVQWDIYGILTIFINIHV